MKIQLFSIINKNKKKDSFVRTKKVFDALSKKHQTLGILSMRPSYVIYSAISKKYPYGIS